MRYIAYWCTYQLNKCQCDVASATSYQGIGQRAADAYYNLDRIADTRCRRGFEGISGVMLTVTRYSGLEFPDPLMCLASRRDLDARIVPWRDIPACIVSPHCPYQSV